MSTRLVICLNETYLTNTNGKSFTGSYLSSKNLVGLLKRSDLGHCYIKFLINDSHNHIDTVVFIKRVTKIKNIKTDSTNWPVQIGE